MARIQLEIDQPQVVTAKCSEPQVVDSDVRDGGSGVAILSSVRTGVRQLKIHKSSKSGLVAAFFCVKSLNFFCCMYVVRCCKLWYDVFGGIPYET